MRVLIACEESQTECTAFRALGHEAKTYFDTGLNWAIVSHWMPIPDPPEE